jgi:acyl-CoA reductase-like NAD-dependent aldehyde dehydrogenase
MAATPRRGPKTAAKCRTPEATVWTRETAQARRLALRLQAGSVVVNATASPSASNVTGLGAEPVKMSGFGPEGGVGGLLAYTRLRSVVFHLE